MGTYTDLCSTVLCPWWPQNGLPWSFWSQCRT